MNTIKQQLLKIGLKDKEIKIYLTLLSLGKGTVSDIARKISINRTTVYNPLDSLLQRGFVYKIILGKRIFYSPEKPKKIISVLEEEKRKINISQENIRKIIPELENLYTDSFNRPKVSFYGGKSGVFDVYEQIVDTWQDVYSVFSPKSFFSLFSYEQNDKLLMKLKEREVKLFNLIEKTDETYKRLEIKKYNSFVKNKILPDELKFSTDLLVTKDRLALISFDSLTAVVIEDKAIADMQRNFIKFVWNKV